MVLVRDQKNLNKNKSFYLFWAIRLSVSGHLMSLSRVFTMDKNTGLCVLSFCQQSNINWYMVSGQSMGAGNR